MERVEEALRERLAGIKVTSEEAVFSCTNGGRNILGRTFEANEGMTDRLSAIGAAISEEDQVVTLLGSLPASYGTVVTALRQEWKTLTWHSFSKH